MPAVAGRLYSKTIILQGDPTSAPVNNGGPVPTQIVETPVQFLPWRSTTITRIGDPNAAPVVSPATPAPVVVQQDQPPQPRTAVILGASAADFYFSGPLISTPIPQRSWAPPAIIVRQLQDGAVAPAGGLVPTTLVITSLRAAPPLPDVIALGGAPAQAPFVATPPAIVKTALPAVRRWQIIVTKPPAASPPGTAPEVPLPTALTLDAFESGVTLDAHQMGVTLDAHQMGVTLDAHQMGLVLDRGDPLATPVFYTGDTWEPLRFTVKDATGAAVDISTALSVRMVAKRVGGTEVITDGAGATTNDDTGSVPTRGRVHYTWGTGDLTVPGDYIPEAEVTWPGGPPARIQTFRTDTEKFTVKADND